MEEMLELIEKLNRWNYEYYSLDNPSVGDKEWDDEYDKLIKLEKEMKNILPNSPTQKVGGEILEGFEKVERKTKLWSLDKSNSFEEIKYWLTKNENFIKEYNSSHTNKLPQLKYILTKKYDGLTVETDYDNINFVQGSTRGKDGIIGENVTEQSKSIINLPIQLKDNDKLTNSLSPHGECIMPKKALIEYNKKYTDQLKNCRNSVAGAIRNLDTKETAKRKLMIYFYNLNNIEKDFQTYQQQLDYMSYRGLPVTDYTVCNTYEDIIKAIDNIEEQRLNLPYDIDGCVIAINDLATRNLMGYTEKFPRFSLAYKYEAEETTTKLLDVEWNVSRYGRLNPKAKIEPVELMGVTVKQATLNNIDDIERKRIKINSEIFIRRSNDVIPEVTGIVDESLNNEDIKDIIYPTICTCCGSPVEIRQPKTTRFLFCTNDSCPDRLIQALSHYVGKEAINIIGFSKETLRQFIDKGFIKSIKDIYNLEQYKEQLIKLPKFGLKKYDNLIKAVEKSKECKLSSFLYALGIENVGKKASKNICLHFNNNLNNIISTNENELLKIEDVGDKISESMVEYFGDKDIINKVNEIISYLTFIEDKPKETIVTQQTPFQGKTLYATGGFNMKKAELKELLESLGAIVETGYKKSLQYLICGHDMSKSGKDKKAMDDNASGKSNITIINEDEFLQIIKGN
jgi:DNA ligase (NAD+)